MQGEGTPGVIMLNFHLSKLSIWEKVFRENEPCVPPQMTPVLLQHIIITLHLCRECSFGVQAALKVFRVMKLQLITTWECCPRLSHSSVPSLAVAVTSNRSPVVEGPYLKVAAEGPSDQYYPPVAFPHISH